MILLRNQNNFVGILKIMSNAAKKFLYSINYFERST